MKKLTILQKQRAAEFVAMAFTHFRVAQKLAKEKEYAAAIGKLYYAAHFSGRATLADTRITSTGHKTWNGELNKRFGRGGEWLPKSYPKLVSKLEGLRNDGDYENSVPNDQSEYEKYFSQTDKFIKKVVSNAPLCYYEEFIEEYLSEEEGIDALEFDYYCPKSYIHKERVQFQVMSEKYKRKTPKTLSRLGGQSVKGLKANRPDDYVLGWNNRLGQAGDRYLLFLDIDEPDEGKVKSAFKNRKGWLFKSGNGYHFIGREKLKSRRHWISKLKQAHSSKKLTEILDERYQNFSEKRGYSTLRMGGSAVKDFKPFLCYEFC